MDTTIYLISNLFRIYTIFRLLGLFFDRKDVKPWLQLTAFLTYYMLNSSIHLLLKNPFANLITNIILFFVLTCIYKGNLSTRFISTVFVCLSSMLLEGIVYNLICGIPFDIDTIVLTGVISDILWFFLVLISEKIFDYKTELKMNIIHGLAIFLIPTGSMALVIIAFITDYSPLFTVICISVLLSINATAFYLFDAVIRSYEQKYEKHLLETQNKAYANQFKIIKTTQDNIRTIRHDIKHYLISMKDMVEAGDREKTLEYIDSFLDKTKTSGEFVSSGNQGIDSILNYKISEAVKLSAATDIRVIVPMELNVDPFDLSVILGNLMDNALEALSRSDAKNLKIDIEYSKSVLYITVINSFDGKIKRRNGKILTTKKDPKNHGVGLDSINGVLNKYDGIMNIDVDDNTFRTDILLYVPLN